MKFAIFVLILLVSIAATCPLFRSGARTIVFSKPLPKSKAHVREQGGIFAHEFYQLRMRRFEFFDGFL